MRDAVQLRQRVHFNKKPHEEGRTAVLMETIPVTLKIDSERVVPALQAAGEKLDAAGDEGKLVLDFSSVRRIDPAVLTAIEKLAATADDKAIKVVLQGVGIEVYKVLKLARLAPRFTFVTGNAQSTSH